MDFEPCADGLIHLAVVSRDTRGGPIGYEEMERSFFITGAMLALD